MLWNCCLFDSLSGHLIRALPRTTNSSPGRALHRIGLLCPNQAIPTFHMDFIVHLNQQVMNPLFRPKGSKRDNDIRCKVIPRCVYSLHTLDIKYHLWYHYMSCMYTQPSIMWYRTGIRMFIINMHILYKQNSSCYDYKFFTWEATK